MSILIIRLMWSNKKVNLYMHWLVARLVIYEYHFDWAFLFSLIFGINIITYCFLSRDTHDNQYRIWFKETNGYTNNKTRSRVFLEHTN